MHMTTNSGTFHASAGKTNDSHIRVCCSITLPAGVGIYDPLTLGLQLISTTSYDDYNYEYSQSWWGVTAVWTMSSKNHQSHAMSLNPHSICHFLALIPLQEFTSYKAIRQRKKSHQGHRTATNCLIIQAHSYVRWLWGTAACMND